MKKIMFNDRFCLTQAVLEGRKTMTRRIIQAPKTWHGIDVYGFSVNRDNYGNVKDISLVGADGGRIEDENGSPGMILPKYHIGEVVAVAQSYNEIYEELKRTHGSSSSVTRDFLHKYMQGGRMPVSNKMFVRADLMPHRINITDIKVERLQDISDYDCLNEGVIKGKFKCFPNDMFFPYINCKDTEVSWTAKYAFAALIDKVSGKGTWEKNQWVFAYSFELIN